MATGPKLATTPLELLENDGTREVPLLSRIWGPLACGVVGICTSLAVNGLSKKPVFSGVQRHIGFTVIGIVIGKVLEDYRNEYYADRDAVFRHYIELHPEDFPPFERQKIADRLDPWVPIR